ncbi:expressed unknown protein [Seminavis robusta]|uniref:Uncharacterized protein n=1 Tax=Seminavis robusta TaxID=568900 RepID=A0A9N8EX88_9STRA|nr:expressed unknown protein [Seminavis robusta]|eukprot:Sro2030_g311810.1 n/a (338) ;mRNA; r:16318-17331
MIRKPLQRRNPTALAKTREKEGRAQAERQKQPFYNPSEFKDRELPLVYKPKVIKQLGDHCYIFHCTVKGNTGNRFNKNMIVLVDRNANADMSPEQQARGVLTLINPLRLSPEGEAKLLELGVLTNLIRLGPSEHAAFEDNYYLTKFPDIQRWAPGPFASCPNLPLDQVLYDTTPTRKLKLDAPISPVSPHPDIQVFVFEETVQPEALLVLSSKRALIAGECLQYQLDNPYVNDSVRTQYHEPLGLLDARIVMSEHWIHMQSVVSTNSKKLSHSFKSRAQRNKTFFSNSGKFKLRNDFVRLLKLELARFISSSGNSTLQDDAVKDDITAAMERACQLV